MARLLGLVVVGERWNVPEQTSTPFNEYDAALSFIESQQPIVFVLVAARVTARVQRLGGYGGLEFLRIGCTTRHGSEDPEVLSSDIGMAALNHFQLL